MLYFYRYIIGYICIGISGEYAEQMLNLTARNRIRMWDLRCRKGMITGYISISDFRRLRIIRRGTHIRVRILEKKGLPFATRRYTQRVGFFAGAVIFFALLYFLSGFVWTIKTTGNVQASYESVLESCREIGVFEMVRKSKINTTAAAEQLLIKDSRFAWASLNIEGCVVTVNVTEVRPKDNDGQPSNLKASADGIIKKIDVTAGNVVVKQGDTVGRGDLLVSGIIENMDSTVFVRSSGSVTAETRRQLQSSGQYKENRIQQNGRSEKRAVLEVFGVKLPLYLGAVRQKYESNKRIYPLKLFGERLPISLTVREFHLLEENLVEHSREELIEMLEEDIQRQIKELAISDYKVLDSGIFDTFDGIMLKKEIVAIENIAIEEKILINTVN